jgi:hypothetical protein
MAARPQWTPPQWQQMSMVGVTPHPLGYFTRHAGEARWPIRVCRGTTMLHANQ